MKINPQGLSRREILDQVQAGYISGELTLGQALKRLRRDIAGLNQKDFAKMCKMSLRTLAAIESDQANPTLSTINQLFGIFGLKVGLVSQFQSVE